MHMHTDAPSHFEEIRRLLAALENDLSDLRAVLDRAREDAAHAFPPRAAPTRVAAAA